jgi:hypothetical protein
MPCLSWVMLMTIYSYAYTTVVLATLVCFQHANTIS